MTGATLPVRRNAAYQRYNDFKTATGFSAGSSPTQHEYVTAVANPGWTL